MLPAPSPSKTSIPIHYQSATQLAQQIARGALRSRDLLEHLLARVDALNPEINAIVVQDRERARRRADAADAASARGERWGPLHGVPFTVKESFDARGLATTFGFDALKDHRADADSVVVQRLLSAGAVLFGKTNVPEALADFQSYNAVYGTTQNPWRSGHTPGGSSGGSAAALAAGFTPLEMGSDIGGSIRNPAHFCGVFGHKPSFGLLPARGHTIHGQLSGPDLAVVGPLARSATDLALMLDLLAQPDEIDAAGLRVALPRLNKPTAALRIAVWDNDPVCPVSGAVRARLAAVCETLGAAGASVDRHARPFDDAAAAQVLYDQLLQSAMGGGLGDEAMAAAIQCARGLSPDDNGPSARVLRAQVMRQREWSRHHEARTQLRWAWHRFFQRFDFVLAPVMPVTAFAHDHGRFGQRSMTVDGRDQPYFDATFWAGLATLAYLPATVLPAGPAEDGLPVGIQIIGPAYGDQLCIGLAQRLQALGFGFAPPPALAA